MPETTCSFCALLRLLHWLYTDTHGACMQVGDALQQPFADNSFDFAWSMESGEHMPDKKKFVGEILRVTKPRGKVVIVTWCHRNLLAGEATLKPDELALLKRISEAYYLPPWCSLADYEDIFGACWELVGCERFCSHILLQRCGTGSFLARGKHRLDLFPSRCCS